MGRIFLIIGVILAVLAGLALGWYVLSARGIDRETLEARYLTEADRHVPAAGVNFRVREQGPADAPALVLIHGFQMSLESFDAWAEILDNEYRVIRFDLPGHGLTGPDPQARYSNQQTVELTHALIEQLGLESFVIGGNSLGGLVAWRYAADYPQDVLGVVLISPGGYSINGVTEDPVAVPLPMKLYLKTAPQSGVTKVLNAVYGDRTAVTAAKVQQTRELMHGKGVGQALIERLKVFTLPDPEADLARIGAPVLILWGEQDALVPPAHGPLFEAAIPNAALVAYEGAGHAAHEERPEETAARARDFIQTLEGENG